MRRKAARMFEPGEFLNRFLISKRSREDHLRWCRERSLAYLARGEKLNAMTSMLSDLSKHPLTRDDHCSRLGMKLLLSGHLGDTEAIRRWVEGCQ